MNTNIEIQNDTIKDNNDSNEDKLNETINVIVKICNSIGWWQYVEFKFTTEGSILKYQVHNRFLSFMTFGVVGLLIPVSSIYLYSEGCLSIDKIYHRCVSNKIKTAIL